MKSFGRLAAAGLVAAVLVGVAGRLLERARFGQTDAETRARIETELRRRFDASAETLGAIASQVASSRELIRTATDDVLSARNLFDVLTAAISRGAEVSTGITVYGHPGANPIAWSGRVSDVPEARIQGPAALFVAPGAFGPRLVRVEPVLDPDRPAVNRVGTVVVEQLLGPVRVTPGVSDTFVLSASLVPVSLRARLGGTTTLSPHSFVISSSEGQLLVEAEVAPTDLAEARNRWRRGTRAAVLSVIGITLLLCTAPLLDSRRRARRFTSVVGATAGLVILLLAARILFLFAAAPLVGSPPATHPLNLVLWALLLAATTYLMLDLVERWRVARRPRLLIGGAAALAQIVLVYFLVGAIDAGLLWAYDRFLQNIVSRTTLDLLHFSLHPLSASRFAIGFGLVLLHAAIIWGAAILIRLASVMWRRPRVRPFSAAAVVAWIGGVATALAIASQRSGNVPLAPLLVALIAAGACGVVLGQPRGRARHASQTTRLVALYLALLLPAAAMYPSLHAFTSEAKERLVAEQYGPQAVRVRDDLQDSLSRALEEIDALPSLSAFIDESAEEGASTDVAYQLWSETVLASLRLTSAVELYGSNGRLVSRFALTLPEYAPASYRAANCAWDIVEEISPFGSSERHVLRASRGICEKRRPVGAIAVRVMLDYRTLSFISSQRPYLASLRTDRQELSETAPGRDVEFVVYGWSRAPLYVSGTSAWPMPDPVFQRMAESREPFWQTLRRNEATFRVYFLNDRVGIYALGYPVITWFGHLVNLAELITLVFALYVLLLAGAATFNALTSRAPASGRALLREVRSSFYRKLFLYFVAVAVVPVFILAFAVRTYFATRLSSGLEEAAVQTATVAQRLVEDYATLQQRGTGALEFLDDQSMLIVGRAIDQAVNLFAGPRLQATSERDLFASGHLPMRTPADVYRRIVLERQPTFVGEDEAGGLSYLVAAAPVRAGGREGIVTVPQNLREREIETQIDDLDRRVTFALVVFLLLGAALGYSMAERIADPVNRLTRATRRIARGDLDARIAATSSDELRRLVEDFNHMAADLKRQRAELERTQRLEAWADMARQVAHDIKNPLTPIQLSAEHARRVNLDRGRPLSPVLDDCVDAILTQVKLLRQISAEFSSFATSPTPRPEVTNLGRLIEEVVEPYRTALTGRIVVDVQTSADIPEITIDRTLFSRALTNVIENALHAMPGEGRLTIRAYLPSSDASGTVAPPASSRASAATASSLASPAVGSSAVGSPGLRSPAVGSGFSRTIIVQIADTGIGMDPEALTKIFEPYFSTKATGTGLGLTIAKRNIELNGGTITVDSRRGAGTTVTITLPA